MALEKKFQISLKAARVNANLTILKAAKAIGIGKDTLIKWEKKPSAIPTIWLSKISEVYGISLDCIFFG